MGVMEDGDREEGKEAYSHRGISRNGGFRIHIRRRRGGRGRSVLWSITISEAIDP